MLPSPPARRLRPLALVAIAAALPIAAPAPPAAAEGVRLDARSLAELPWRDVGPSATGGRLTDIAVRDGRPSEIYAAAASGGLFRTINGGTTWDCIFQDQGTISIGDIALDPTNEQVIWVGTGEANSQRSSYWGDGIYKSTDGGASWTNTGLPDSGHIGRIVVDPTDGDTVWVAALGHLYSHNEQRGLYKTTDGGQTWERSLFIDPAVGVVDVVLDPSNPDVVYAASYERLRRAWHFDGNGPGSGIWKSMDGGASWTKLTGGLPTGDIGRIGLAISPRNPRLLYATVSNQNVVEVGTEQDAEEASDGPGVRVEPLELRGRMTGDGFEVLAVDRRGVADRGGMREDDVLVAVGGVEVVDPWSVVRTMAMLRAGDRIEVRFRSGDEERTTRVTVPEPRHREIGGEIYRSTDAGLTWTKTNDRPVGGTPAYYYGQIYIDPNGDDRLYVCSVPLWTSDDGGKTWSNDTARSVHVDHHAMWIDPANSDHILLGNDGGMHVSWDMGATWDHVFNLPLTQFYAIGYDMQEPYHVYGGTQDNGSWGGPSQSRSPAGVGRFDWYRVGGGDGFYVVPDPNDSNVIFGESQFGYLYRFHRDSGERVSIRPPRSDPNGPPDRYNWMSPIVMSHHNPRTIYFGGNKLFKSYNRGDDWLVVSPDLTTADPQRLVGNVPHCTITTISESPLDPDVLLVGTDDGLVHWTDDGGETWRDLSDRFPLRASSWWCSRVTCSAKDARTAYVSFTGYREDDFRPFLFMTTDGGRTWSRITGNLPMGPINVVAEDPVNHDLLWVGTEFGAWASWDHGGHWTNVGDDLPTIAVHDLKVHPRDHDLIVGTHGRGIFIMDVAALQQMSPEIMAKDEHLFDVEDATLWRQQWLAGISGDRKLMAANPQYGAAIVYRLGRSMEDEDVTLEIRDAGGDTIAELEAGGAPGLHRVVWPLRAESRGRRPRFVEPGEYTAVLTVGSTVMRSDFDVRADPLPPAAR